MLCARVMRGTSSSANSVAPVAAIFAVSAVAVSGSRKPIRTCPGRSRARSLLTVSGVGAEGAGLRDDLGFLKYFSPGSNRDAAAGIIVIRESGFEPGGDSSDDFESCLF